MYKIQYIENDRINVVNVPTFHQMMNLSVDLHHYASEITISYNGAVVYKYIAVDEDEIAEREAERESLGNNWW